MFRYCRIVRNTIIIDLKQQIDMILPFISCCADWNYNILIILLLHNIYVDANVAVRESINDFLLTAIHLELNCIPIYFIFLIFIFCNSNWMIFECYLAEYDEYTPLKALHIIVLYTNRAMLIFHPFC